MADSVTANYDLVKVEVGQSIDTWGGKINDNMDKLDTAMKAIDDRVSEVEGAPTDIGQVSWFAMATPPTGWYIANGTAKPRLGEGALLYAQIGTTYGAGDGATTYNVPDLRGEFIRGVDLGRGIDAGRVLGSAQADLTRAHTHTASSAAAGAHTHPLTIAAGGAHTHTLTIAANGNHSHTGVADSNGAHAHNFTGSGGNTTRPNGANSMVPTEIIAGQVTSTNGAHTHSLTINAAGNHTHTGTADSAGSHTHTGTADSAGSHSHVITVDATVGSETRPRNVALLPCIKFA